MADSYVRIQGAKEIAAKMKELSAKANKKFVKQGLREGCKILQKQAQANAPIKTGATKRNIRIKVAKAAKDSVAVMVTVGRKMFQGEQFYAAFQEFGFFLGKRVRGTKNKEAYHAASVAAGRRFVQGKHFFENAYKAKHDEAQQKAQDVITDLIMKEPIQ